MDDTGASGDYFTDALRLGNATVTNFTMALGTDITGQPPITPVCGVGPNTNGSEATVSGGTYDNLPYALRDRGVINTVAYSLLLGDEGLYA